jgi:copper(I)-binding protein
VRKLYKSILITAGLISSMVAWGKSANEDIMIRNAHVRPMPPGTHNTAAYMNLENTGHEDHVLVEVKSHVADKVMLHKNVYHNNTVQMKHVPRVKILMDNTVKFKRGGYHIMLIGVHKHLHDGDVVPLTLVFADDSKIHVDAKVR